MGRLFQAFGAAMENARSDETRNQSWLQNNQLPAEWREAWPGTLATDVTNSVKYDGARPLIEWWTKRQSLKWFSLQLATSVNAIKKWVSFTLKSSQKR